MTSLNKLLDIIAVLRDPENGCPWDLQQDFKSVAVYTLEEAYEVVDAIEQNDMEELKSELGDLLLQVVFHAHMAKEKGYFQIDDVIEEICNKLIRRNPYMFGDKKKDGSVTAEDARLAWEEVKKEERANKPKKEHIVPTSFPALTRSQKIQEKTREYASIVNYEFAFKKMDEELCEFKEALKTPENKEHLEEELGDLLLCTIGNT